MIRKISFELGIIKDILRSASRLVKYNRSLRPAIDYLIREHCIWVEGDDKPRMTGNVYKITKEFNKIKRS